MKGITMKHKLSNETVKLMNMLFMPVAAMAVVTAFFYSSLCTYEAALARPLILHAVKSNLLSFVIAIGGGLLFDAELKLRSYSSSDKS